MRYHFSPICLQRAATMFVVCVTLLSVMICLSSLLQIYQLWHLWVYEHRNQRLSFISCKICVQLWHISFLFHAEQNILWPYICFYSWEEGQIHLLYWVVSRTQNHPAVAWKNTTPSHVSVLVIWGYCFLCSVWPVIECHLNNTFALNFIRESVAKQK